jgi:hypothetical protein
MIPSRPSEIPLQLNTWESHALDVRSISSPLNLGANNSESPILTLYAISTNFHLSLPVMEATTTPRLLGYSFQTQ